MTPIPTFLQVSDVLSKFVAKSKGSYSHTPEFSRLYGTAPFGLLKVQPSK